MDVKTTSRVVYTTILTYYHYLRYINQVKKDDLMEVLAPELRVEKETADAETIKEWRTRGLKEMSENTVGVILMAGGQGTRLGKKGYTFLKRS